MTKEIAYEHAHMPTPTTAPLAATHPPRLGSSIPQQHSQNEAMRSDQDGCAAGDTKNRSLSWLANSQELSKTIGRFGK